MRVLHRFLNRLLPIEQVLERIELADLAARGAKYVRQRPLLGADRFVVAVRQRARPRVQIANLARKPDDATVEHTPLALPRRSAGPPLVFKKRWKCRRS
jgi:hypothetical protein